MLVLNEAQLRSALKLREVIDAVERGFRALARGEAIVPERLRLDIPERDAVLLQMPAYLREGDNQSTLGTKLVSVFPKNTSRSLEVVQAVYILLDSETGAPLAVMEGSFITGIRTAATSALATKLMAPTGKKRLGVFGAGVQARFHIEAMIEVAEVREVMIASRTAERAHSLAETVRRIHGLPCAVVPAEHAAAEADLICTCTTSPAPLFEGSSIKPGTHINAVGAFTPSTRELDTEAIRRSRVIIDHELAAGREAGEILIPLAEGSIEPSHLKGTLADIVSGKIAGRESKQEITVFRSCGLALEDLVTAQLAYERAAELGIGVQVKL